MRGGASGPHQSIPFAAAQGRCQPPAPEKDGADALLQARADTARGVSIVPRLARRSGHSQWNERRAFGDRYAEENHQPPRPPRSKQHGGRGGVRRSRSVGQAQSRAPSPRDVAAGGAPRARVLPDAADARYHGALRRLERMELQADGRQHARGASPAARGSVQQRRVSHNLSADDARGGPRAQPHGSEPRPFVRPGLESEHGRAGTRAGLARRANQRGDGVPPRHERHHRGKDVSPPDLQAVSDQQGFARSEAAPLLQSARHARPLPARGRKRLRQWTDGNGEHLCRAQRGDSCRRRRSARRRRGSARGRGRPPWW
mmetsp:Transcript_22147/g.71721  ORF Transcript_22147/g.71721 Transcript_22147/m.71721 type:complete len:316 (-) Transcript_22147:144-1091(-)